MPIKSYFEKKISDLIKQFLKKGFAKNSVVSQNIKNVFSILVLELKPTTIAGWRFLKFQKKSKSLHPNVHTACN